MILDTSGLLCCLDRRELRHSEAVALFRAASIRLTHDYVLAELVALAYARGLDRARTLEFITDLLGSPDVEVVWVDETLHRAALSFLGSRLDKGYSLCDAVSFLLMRHSRLSDALTTDRHFEQEGFVRLLRP